MVATPEDRVRARARAAAVVAVAASAVGAAVGGRTALAVAALVADVAVLLALVAANRRTLFRRQHAVRAIGTLLGANLPLPLANLLGLGARELAGADAAPDALAVIDVVGAALRESLGRDAEEQGYRTQKKTFLDRKSTRLNSSHS